MQFAHYGMLSVLAALAIPIVVHLMFRRRARTVELGTLQFLKVVLRDDARKRRLKRYALLALRLAGVALIALLFARPFLLAEEPGRGDRTVAVLVDRSASMGLAGRARPIDRAKAEARAILARAGSGSRVEVAAFDRDVAPLAKLADLDAAIAGPPASGTDFDAAMAWARDLAARPGTPLEELHILTDLQRSGLGRGEAARMPPGVTVRLIDLGRPFPKNVAVTGVVVSPTSPRPGETTAIAATVRNASPLPVAAVPVRLHLEAEGHPPIDLDRTLDLDGDSSTTVEFTLPEPGEGLWRGHVEARAGDDLAFDDRRYLAVLVAPAAKVVLADGDPGRSASEAETYFLLAALRLAPEGQSYAKAPFDPSVVDPSRGLPDLAGVSAVVLANVADLAAADARDLAEFVAKGGGLVVFTGDRVTADGAASLVAAGLGVGRVVGPATAEGRPFRLDRWDATHPILRPFADPEHGDLRRPAFTTITKIVPDPSARVLARFRDGEPALLERPVGRGKVVWFASACDRGWGDWPRGRMFLPMAHQLVAHASGLADGGPIRPDLAGPGRPPGIVDADGLVRVVNPDPYESETARCTPREFADRYGFTPAEPAPAASAPPDDSGTSAEARPRGEEAWPWVALALIGMLLGEQFLANRTAA
jgi:hypothetical protein